MRLKFSQIVFGCGAISVLVSCGHDSAAELREYYRQQSLERITVLTACDTPAAREGKALHEEIEKIVLVSKDSENPGAALALARQLFDNVCAAHHFSRIDFPDLHAGMDLQETELQLRENELAVLNRLLLANDNCPHTLFSAH